MDELIRKAIMNTFQRYYEPSEFDGLVAKVEKRLTLETGSNLPSPDYTDKMAPMDGMLKMVRRIKPSNKSAAIASAIQFILDEATP